MNPWPNLPKASPFILHEDRCPIDAFNALASTTAATRIQTNLLPEPFFGNPDAPVVALALNPGYSSLDERWHVNPAFAETIRQTYAHTNLDFPHYYFDPRFIDCPGSIWWRAKSRWLIDECGLEAVAKNILCIQLFPYHSQRYKPLPKKLLASGILHSFSYTASLVKKAMADRCIIILMRSAKQWFGHVPALADYDLLCRIRNPRNVALSPRNLTSFSTVKNAIVAYG